MIKLISMSISLVQAFRERQNRLSNVLMENILCNWKKPGLTTEHTESTEDKKLKKIVQDSLKYEVNLNDFSVSSVPSVVKNPD